jgi:hypothetical protein
MIKEASNTPFGTSQTLPGYQQGSPVQEKRDASQ